MVAPGFAKPLTTNNQPISLVDLYPTLSDLAGLKAPSHLEGESIVALMKDPELKRPYAYISYGPENTAVQTESMRYIRYEDGSEELYNHDNDPHEWINLADSREYRAIKQTFKEQASAFQYE